MFMSFLVLFEGLKTTSKTNVWSQNGTQGPWGLINGFCLTQPKRFIKTNMFGGVCSMLAPDMCFMMAFPFGLVKGNTF